MNQTERNRTERQETQKHPTFPFFSGVLALDLVNTDILLRGKRYDFLTTPKDAVEWWNQANLHHPNRETVKGEAETTQWNSTMLDVLKGLRGALRHIFLSHIEQRPINAVDLEELNTALALGHRSLELNRAGDPIPIYQTSQPQSGAVLLPLALSALHVIIEGERGRLHECANERCIGLFYDTSRSATRQWCSPECMNRARSLQHYRQTKAEKVLPRQFP